MKNERVKYFTLLMVFASIMTSFFFPCDLVAKKQRKKEPYRLSATAIFCNEAPYIREWIEYYLLIGIDHFYLYNNLSTDDYLAQLTPYIDTGVVELIQWPKKASNWSEWDQIQVDAYRDALERSQHKTKWLAILDCDEFVVPVKIDHLPTILKEYENREIGGICSMWSFFGTSHVEKIPSRQLMLETLTFHSGPACNGDVSSVWSQGAYKSIVRPAYVSNITSPHYCHYIKGRHHEMVPYDVLHINHYWTRDNDFFMNTKIPRRQAWGQDSATALAWASGMNGTSENNPILRFVTQLREKMGYTD